MVRGYHELSFETSLVEREPIHWQKNLTSRKIYVKKYIFFCENVTVKGYHILSFDTSVVKIENISWQKIKFLKKKLVTEIHFLEKFQNFDVFFFSK